MASEMAKCAVCENDLRVTWTDTHGVAVCMICGAPHRLYHYESDKRVEKPPSCELNESGIEIAKRYWSEKRRRVYPGCFDMGILHGRNRTYSGATADDMLAFGDWYEANAYTALHQSEEQ